MTTAPTITPWYDSHENLYKLAEWIREHNGWAFFEKNAIDLLEKPWKWENEWRIASGNVEFKLIERPDDIIEGVLPEGIACDRNQCAWCKCLVGLVSFEHELGGMHEYDWVTVYVDILSGDYGCDDCAGAAPNFAETTAVPALPELTDEMRAHFAAFDHTELFPVMITRDVATELGNVLIPEGTRTWGARNGAGLSHGTISVWTADTHYAGVKSSSIPTNCFIRLAGAAVAL